MDPMTPEDSPLSMSDVMSSPLYGDLSTPKLGRGDPAADFSLPYADRPGGVRLSEHFGKRPVALIFGSYS